MSLVKIRRAAQITLPSEARKKFDLKEGDYLEAELRDGAILLRPVSVIDRAKAREELDAILARVKPTKAATVLSEDEVLAVAVKEVKASRRELRGSSAAPDTNKAGLATDKK